MLEVGDGHQIYRETCGNRSGESALVVHGGPGSGCSPDGVLLREARALRDIPGVLINGRFDFQSPIAYAWELARAWPGAELVIVDDSGHGTSTSVCCEIDKATDRFDRAQLSCAVKRVSWIDSGPTSRTLRSPHGVTTVPPMTSAPVSARCWASDSLSSV